MNRKVDLGDPLPLPYKPSASNDTITATNTSFEPIKPIKLERKPPIHIKLKDKIDIRHDKLNVVSANNDHINDRLFEDTTLVKNDYNFHLNQIENELTQLTNISNGDISDNVQTIKNELQEIYKKHQIRAEAAIDNNHSETINQLELQIMEKQLQLDELKQKLAEESTSSYAHPHSNESSTPNDNNIFVEIERLQKLQQKKVAIDPRLLIVIVSIFVFLISGILVSDLKYDYCYYFC